MLKKVFTLILLFAFIITSTGCSERLKRKFIRTSEKKEDITPVFHPEDYKKEFSNKQLYLNHYTYWKTWESEIITRLGQNRKKDRTMAASCLDELKKTKEYLIESKQSELEPYVEKLDTLVQEILNKDLSYGKAYDIKRELERHLRKVEKNFSFRKMTDFIKPD